MTRPASLAALLILFTACHTAPAAPPASATGKPWLDMDYGPYKSTTVELEGQEGNFAYKAVVIPLNAERTASVIFDEDTMRYAAGVGGWLNLTGVDYDGKHWAYPKTSGPILYSNPVGPGWANPAATSADEAFKDPRFRGNDSKPYGPMPHDWAKWNGLYLHGQTVILSYSIGGVEVLETPALETVNGLSLFTRTLNIAPSAKPLTVQIAQEEKLVARVMKPAGDALTPADHADPVSSIVVIGETKGSSSTLAIGYAGDARASWTVQNGAARLTIAPHEKHVRLKLIVWRGESDQLTAFAASTTKLATPADLSAFTKGGPKRWDRTLTTKATPGAVKKGSPFVTDILSWPDDNPWKSWMRFGGFDFFEGGERAAICTWSGDVWTVEGIAAGDKLGELKWRRIATGMFQPLGLKIVDGDIYVCCRDQITKLVDLNGDGETDFYQNFNNDHQVTEHFHEFAMDLQTDKEGNFYYAKSARHARDSLVQHHGTLIKVSKDGSKSQIIANGYRAANGVGVGPGGEFFTSDQEGHWMPANRINLVKPGSFSGNMYSYHIGDKPKDYDRPIVWLPKQIDRSPAEQVWVSSDKWGLPKDSLISLSYGTGHLQHVMYEKVEGLDPNVTAQGAFHRLPVQFPTGVMRGRFHEGDGQLYACGLFGWSSNQTRPGGFYRVRYVGKSCPIPVKFLAATDGVVIEFNEPIDKELGSDAESFLVEQWNYKWSGSYGSPEFRLSDNSKGRDKIEVKAARLSKDGRRIWIEMPNLQKSMQIRVKYDLETAAGDELADDLYGSIFVIPQRSGAALLEPSAE